MAQSSGEEETPKARRNRRSASFRDLFAELPDAIQELAYQRFKLFEQDPRHPSLQWHRLKDNDKGEHKNGSISVRVNKQYRAIYVEIGDVNLWYWIGTHAEYDRFTGVKKILRLDGSWKGMRQSPRDMAPPDREHLLRRAGTTNARLGPAFAAGGPFAFRLVF